MEAPQVFFQNVVVRSGTEAILGESGATVAIMVIGALGTSLATVAFYGFLCVRATPHLDTQQRWMAFLLGGAGLSFLVATVNFTDPHSIDVSHGIANASRYALAPSLFLGAFILLVLSHLPRRGLDRILVVGTCVVMALASAVDSRGDEWSTHGPTWRSSVEQGRQACQGQQGKESVTLEVTPQGVPMDWTTQVSCDWLLQDR